MNETQVPTVPIISKEMEPGAYYADSSSFSMPQVPREPRQFVSDLTGSYQKNQSLNSAPKQGQATESTTTCFDILSYAKAYNSMLRNQGYATPPYSSLLAMKDANHDGVVADNYIHPEYNHESYEIDYYPSGIEYHSQYNRLSRSVSLEAVIDWDELVGSDQSTASSSALSLTRQSWCSNTYYDTPPYSPSTQGRMTLASNGYVTKSDAIKSCDRCLHRFNSDGTTDKDPKEKQLFNGVVSIPSKSQKGWCDRIKGLARIVASKLKGKASEEQKQKSYQSKMKALNQKMDQTMEKIIRLHDNRERKL
ncbi:hypothetical protein BGZ76_003474 [Entomortierella beljakovae]|nr:hypothetical protein BGZ76_003474 [Entomortierella beljakovae]